MVLRDTSGKVTMAGLCEMRQTAYRKYRLLDNKSNEYNELWEFIERRQALMDLEIFSIINQEREKKFYKILNDKEEKEERKEIKRKIRRVNVFHSPHFQEDKCKFDFDRNMCTGHKNNILCFTENVLYSYCNKDKRTKETSEGYFLLVKIIIGNVIRKDPEETQPLMNYLGKNYDTILDYGNKKCFKIMSDEVLPYCLIFYRRRYNSRLDDPIHQSFEAANRVPPPEFTYEELDHNNETFKQFCRWLSSYKIVSVNKIVNPYLTTKYEEIKEKYSGNAKEITVFHSTLFEYADLIAKYNLDWRKAQYGKYGWGVHLVAVAYDAAINYPVDKRETIFAGEKGDKKCMMVFNLLRNEEKLYEVKRNEDDLKKLSDMILPP